MQLVFEETYVLDKYSFVFTFIAFVFQKFIMTDFMLANEMKRHAMIGALKADLGDLEIACFIRVARSFVPGIRIELKKKKKRKENENKNVISVTKGKKNHSTRSESRRTLEFINKVKQIIDENRGDSMKSMGKRVECVNQKECS